MDNEDKNKQAFVYFLYNDLGIAVKIPAGKGCYHTFSGNFGNHQTAVPVTFDGSTVSFNDDNLFVFAWGNGKSEERVYIESQGHQFPANHRITQDNIDNFSEVSLGSRGHICNAIIGLLMMFRNRLKVKDFSSNLYRFIKFDYFCLNL